MSKRQKIQPLTPISLYIRTEVRKQYRELYPTDKEIEQRQEEAYRQFTEKLLKPLEAYDLQKKGC